MALTIKLTGTPYRYFQSLDKPTRKRIADKLEAIAAAPSDARLSYPLINSETRSARVGGYRILLEIDKSELTVVEIGPRGQIYRKL